jgi:hypothetical protein
MRDAVVARARDQAVAVPEKNIESHAGGKAGFLKANKTQHIVDKN